MSRFRRGSVARTGGIPLSKRLAARTQGIERRERALLAVAVVVGVAIRIAYLLVTRHHVLAADEVEYDLEGRFIASGHWWWSTTPLGIAHATAVKAPLYPLWVGMWYSILGHHPIAVRAAQVPMGAITIVLIWLLARRLFSSRVALAAAFVVAVYPMAFQYEELLYSEALATPLTIAALLAVLSPGPPSRRRAVIFGVLLGVALLVRPSSLFLIAGAAVAWVLLAGARAGLRLTVAGVLVAALVVAPWAIRNAFVVHSFVPLSLQEPSVAVGTFNAVAAHDPRFPFAWRQYVPGESAGFSHRVSDAALRSRMIAQAVDYIRAHPASVLEAFYWNGLTRLWDIRRPSNALHELRFERRNRVFSKIGLYTYYVLLPLALIGLWRARRRAWLVAALGAIALAASVVYTIDAGTRYRAPLEPVIAMLACAGVLGTSGLRPGGLVRNERRLL